VGAQCATRQICNERGLLLRLHLSRFFYDSIEMNIEMSKLLTPERLLHLFTGFAVAAGANHVVRLVVVQAREGRHNDDWKRHHIVYPTTADCRQILLK
jgi:hypothetical protein